VAKEVLESNEIRLKFLSDEEVMKKAKKYLLLK
jgi:hypothetical protein